MGKTFTCRHIDISTVDAFQFKFYCDLCGKEWTSTPVKYYIKANSAYQSLEWNSARDCAFEGAKQEGMLLFKQCSICNGWVCAEHYDSVTGTCAYCKTE